MMLEQGVNRTPQHRARIGDEPPYRSAQSTVDTRRVYPMQCPRLGPLSALSCDSIVIRLGHARVRTLAPFELLCQELLPRCDVCVGPLTPGHVPALLLLLRRLQKIVSRLCRARFIVGLRGCGSWTGPTNSVGPFVVGCHGQTGDWVTVRQLGSSRYLTIVGLSVYAALAPARAAPPPSQIEPQPSSFQGRKIKCVSLGNGPCTNVKTWSSSAARRWRAEEL